MRSGDAFDNNQRASRTELAALHAELFGWSLSRCHGDCHAAEDLLQEAYVELISGRARFDGQSSLKTFMCAVIQNLSRSRYRTMMRRLRLLASHAAVDADALATEPVETGDAAVIWSAVASLPPRQRDIAELVFQRDLTVAEASSVLGISVGSARQHYARAKKALAAQLAELGQAREGLA